MNKIPSFTINHNKLLRGIYVSRKDEVGGEVVTTFDIRMKVPNQEPCLHNGAIHTIEHLAATYLRNDEEWKDRIIYWGPMGCLTGQLPPHQGRSGEQGHRRTDEAYLPVHCRFRRRNSWTGSQGLRQLSAPRPAYG